MNMNKLFLIPFAVSIMTATVGSIAPEPTQMVVTVEARHGGAVPALTRHDFIVHEGKQILEVTDAVPLRGSDANLELWLLIDDASRWTVGSELNNVRDFIEAQPETTAIGVGYLRNGTMDTVSPLTRDHIRAAKSLRLPMNEGSSPYLSLSDLVKRWPRTAARHEVVMVTSGVDPLGGPGPLNPYLLNAIADAQRAEVIVYTIYEPGIGHEGRGLSRINWGQNDLAELTEETGGEAYGLIYGAPVSTTPYFDSIAAHLLNQYRVSFLANPGLKPGLKQVKFTTEVPNTEIVAASMAVVPGTR